MNKPTEKTDEAEIAMHTLAGEMQCCQCKEWMRVRRFKAIVPGKGAYCIKCYHKLFMNSMQVWDV